jgi:hypothetical protein
MSERSKAEERSGDGSYASKSEEEYARFGGLPRLLSAASPPFAVSSFLQVSI